MNKHTRSKVNNLFTFNIYICQKSRVNYWNPKRVHPKRKAKYHVPTFRINFEVFASFAIRFFKRPKSIISQP